MVVDSGALSTTVAVIVNGRVMPCRWRLLPIGGWNVACNLKDAIKRQRKECDQIIVTNLDTMAVKEKCRLRYNAEEEDKKRWPSSSKREHVNIRVDNYGELRQFWVILIFSLLNLF